MKYSSRFRNATINEPEVELGTVEAPDKGEGKVWGFLDNFFGVADKSADIYKDIRTTQVYGPPPPAYQGIPEQNRNTTAYIVGGVVVAAIIGILIFKK